MTAWNALDIFWNWTWAQVIFPYYSLHKKLRLQNTDVQGPPGGHASVWCRQPPPQGVREAETWRPRSCQSWRCCQGHFHAIIIPCLLAWTYRRSTSQALRSLTVCFWHSRYILSWSRPTHCRSAPAPAQGEKGNTFVCAIFPFYWFSLPLISMQQSYYKNSVLTFAIM